MKITNKKIVLLAVLAVFVGVVGTLAYATTRPFTGPDVTAYSIKIERSAKEDIEDRAFWAKIRSGLIANRSK